MGTRHTVDTQPSRPILRLVPQPAMGPDAGGGPARRRPDPAVFHEIDAKVRAWLAHDALDGCHGLRRACIDVLGHVSELLTPYASGGPLPLGDFRQVAARRRHLYLVPAGEDIIGGRHPGVAAGAGGSETKHIPDPEGDGLNWGAREFLRLAGGGSAEPDGSVAEPEGIEPDVFAPEFGPEFGLDGDPPDSDDEGQSWGVREFLRLAEVAQKVTPLPRPPLR